MSLWSIPPVDARIGWHGVRTVLHEGGVSSAFRLAANVRGVIDPVLQERAEMPAGVRLRFRTDSTSIGLRTPHRGGSDEASMPAVDLVEGDGSIHSSWADADGLVLFSNLPDHERDVELWLPQHGRFGIAEILLETGATLLAAPADAAPRLAVYGSSITQCRRAASPTQTWPAIAARALGWDLTCLGFSGECHLDPEALDAIVASRPTTVILCLGINVYSTGSFTSRSFAPAIRGFVRGLQRQVPDAHIYLCSPIASAAREEVIGGADMTLEEVRETVRSVAQSTEWDQSLTYVDGRDILTPEDAHLLADGLHPNAAGYALMGERWARVLQVTGPKVL